MGISCGRSHGLCTGICACARQTACHGFAAVRDSCVRLVRASPQRWRTAGSGWTAGTGEPRSEVARSRCQTRWRESRCEAALPSRDGSAVACRGWRRPAPAARALSGARPCRQRMTRAPISAWRPTKARTGCAAPSSPGGAALRPEASLRSPRGRAIGSGGAGGGFGRSKPAIPSGVRPLAPHVFSRMTGGEARGKSRA